MKKIFNLLLFLISNTAFAQSPRDNCQETLFVKDTTICVFKRDLNTTILHYFLGGKKIFSKQIYTNGVETDIRLSIDENFDNGQCYKYKNNILQEEVTLKDGYYEGIGKSYYNNGIIKEIANYRKGKQIGKAILFYENGKPREEHEYDEKGKPRGIFKTYCDDGTLFVKTPYEKGKKNGNRHFYYPNGNLMLSLLYEDGKLMSIIECLDQFGNPLEKGTLKDGNGEVYLYTFEGKIDCKIKVKNGKERFFKNKCSLDILF